MFYLAVLEADDPGPKGHEFKLKLFKAHDYIE